jgi:CheY-like chemotaxis protein
MMQKILVVDDEAHIRHVVSMKLERAGYDVVMASDGEEALEACRTAGPDLIITDYQMPVMSGLEFCRQRLLSTACGGVPAIMLTARGFDISPEELAEAGIVCQIDKPFSPREIVSKVQEILAQAPAGSE